MQDARPFDILPAIDMRGGRVVRLVQGDFDRETAYATDPVAVALQFAGAGASWLHVVDLDAARTGGPADRAVITAIATAVGEGVRVEVAGGLRDRSAVAEALEAGAARAVIGTAALSTPAFVGDLLTVYGASRIAVAIDVRDGRAVGHGWSPTEPGVDALEAIRRLADEGVQTFEVTAIDRDGLLGGPDLTLYGRLVALDRGIILASGGIATTADLIAVGKAGCGGAIIGRALYEGRLSLGDALEVASR